MPNNCRQQNIPEFDINGMVFVSATWSHIDSTSPPSAHFVLEHLSSINVTPISSPSIATSTSRKRRRTDSIFE
jgi:hypothetical protein